MNVTEAISLSLEIGSVLCNLAFIVLLTQRKSSAWFYGILGSLAGAVLFYLAHLYSETGLYLFYALVGAFGWYSWTRPKAEKPIRKAHAYVHVSGIFFATFISFVLGDIMSDTNADKPYLDAFSSVFGVFATYLEVNRFLSGWIYWIVLNLFSVWLYASKGVMIYAGLMIVYALLSVKGYRQWKSTMNDA